MNYESLSKQNPRLIYCSITGFGQTGPYKDRPGYDFLVQAMGGLMSVTGDEKSGPQKVGVALTDVMTGLYATVGILTAITEREKSGLGQHVDLALLDVTAATLANQATNFLVGDKVPTGLGNAHPNIVPYQSFETADGHMIVAVGNDGQFKRFCQVINLAGLADDEHYASNEQRVLNRVTLVPMLQAQLKRKNRDEWLAEFEKHQVPAGPINTIDEVFSNEQILARDMRVKVKHALNDELELPGNPIKLSRTPVSYDKAPPLLGQHTESVFKQFGIDES